METCPGRPLQMSPSMFLVGPPLREVRYSKEWHSFLRRSIPSTPLAHSLIAGPIYLDNTFLRLSFFKRCLKAISPVRSRCFPPPFQSRPHHLKLTSAEDCSQANPRLQLAFYINLLLPPSHEVKCVKRHIGLVAKWRALKALCAHDYPGDLCLFLNSLFFLPAFLTLI